MKSSLCFRIKELQAEANLQSGEIDGIKNKNNSIDHELNQVN